MPTLPNVSPELIKAYRNEVARSASPATLKRKNISLNKFFNWAETEGYIEKNPLIIAPPPAKKPHKSYILNPKSLAIAGMTFGMALLAFALVWKIQSPIQFIKGLASGNIPESRIQTLPGKIPEPTPTPSTSGRPIPDTPGVGLDSPGVFPTATTIPAIGGAEILIEGETVTIKTADGSDGNIEINPDGSGITHFLFEGTGENFLNAQAPNLTSGSLYYGIVANNATGYDLLRLQSGSKPITRLSVDALGNTFIGGAAAVSKQLTANGIENKGSYSQSSGNFTITQSPGNFASISKKGSALSNVLNLTLDERNYANSGYSTLVLNRYNGAAEALALLVDEGNARFDGQLQLGRFSSNPNSIGQGSIIFNTTDSAAYVWSGSSWVAFAGSGANADTLDLLDSTQFLRSDTSDSFTSGTLTTDSGTTLDINGDLVVSDSSIAFDAINTTLAITGALTVTTGTSGNTGIILPNNAIGPNEILSTSQTDEFCLTYESTGGTWEWQGCAGAGAMNSFTVAGDSGGGQTISDGNTLSILGGSNGIDTADSVIDTVTLNLDTTEIGSTTFGSGSGITWTFDASAGTDPTIAFGNNTLTFTAGTSTFTGTVSASDLSCTDCLDFTDFEDTLDLDADLIVNQSTSTWTQNFTGTTGTGLSYVANSLTTGEALDVTAALSPTDGSTNEFIDINLTNSPATLANTSQGINLSLTDATALANTLYGTYTTVDNSGNTSTGTHSIYGGYFTSAGKTTGTTTAVGLYASATGADNNYAAIFENGNVGIGDTSPDVFLEVLGTTEQLRLTNVDGTTDARFTVSSTGDLTIDMLGSGTTDQLVLGDTDVINIGGSGSADVAYNVIGDSTAGAANVDSDDDLYIEGNLEVDGTIYGTVSGSAGSVAWDDITNPTDNLTLTMAAYNTTFNWDPGDNSAETAFSLTFDGQDTAADEDQVLIALSQIANVTDSVEAADALLTFANSDANDPVENAIRFDAGGAAAADFTYGINFDAASFGTAEIILSNSETIDNTVDGVVALSGDLAITGGNITTAVTADSTLTVTGTLTANGALDANGQVDLGDAGETITLTSSDWTVNATGDVTNIGSVGMDGDLTMTQATPSLLLVDNTASSDDYSINVDANTFNIKNDTDTRTELSFDGAGGITLGSATATAINLTTDSTGDAEIVLPNTSVGPNEVMATGQTDEYCLTYEGTGSTWAWQDCGSAATVAWSSLAAPTADLTLAMATWNTTFNWVPTADTAETNFSLTTQGNDAVAGGEVDQILLALSQTSNGVDTDQAADSLLTFANNDLNDPVTSAIRFDAGAAGTDFTYGINFDAASFGTAEIILSNSETIDNVTDGTVNIGTTTLKLTGGTDLVSDQASVNLFNATTTTLSLGGAATTALDLGNGGGNYTVINLGSGSGTHTINIAGTGATSSDTINIGTGGTSADTVNIGSSASTTALNFTSGTSPQTFTSSNATGTTTSSSFVFSDTALTTGTELYVAGTSTPTTNTAIKQNLIDITYAQGTIANSSGFAGFGINFTNATTVAGNTEWAARIQNQATSSTPTDTSVWALLNLDNADTATGNLITVGNGLLITNSGAASGGMTNGITIGVTTQPITTALNVGSTGVTTDISLQNGETIDNDTDNQINLNLGTSGTLLLTSSTTSTIANSAGDNTFDIVGDIILDADGADIYFKDAGTTILTTTNVSTDVTLDIAGGNLNLADGDVINIGGVTGALAYNTIASDTDVKDEAAIAADNDLYVGGDVEIDGTLYAASVTATALAWDDITSPTDNLTLTMAAYNTTFNWDPGADSAETSFSLTTQGEDAVAGGEVDQILLSLSQTSNGVDTDQAADSLLTFANNDLNDPVTSAIRFDAGAAGTDFTYGINFDAASIGTAEIVLQNAETIDNVTDGTIAFGVGGAAEINLSATNLFPSTSDGNALGSTTNMWSDLFLASGGVINFDNGDVTLTHAANLLTIGGGNLDASTNTILNIGSTDTDFSATGGLTLADILTVNDDVDINLAAGENIAIADSAAATVDAISLILDAGTVTDTVDGLYIDFRTGNPVAASTNTGINLDLTSAGDAANEVLVGLDLTLTGTSGTERGINFGDNNFDTDINAATDLTLGIGGTNEITLTATALSPSTSDGNALGTSSLMWSDLFIASGGVINFDNGDVTLTHAANALDIAGGDFNVAIIDGQTINLDGDGSPTADILQIGSGDNSITAGVDALQIAFDSTNASGNAVDITLNGIDGDGTDTTIAIDIDAFTYTSSAGTNTVQGLSIGNLTEAGVGVTTSTAISVGSGWDTLIGGTTAGTNILSFTNATLTSAGALTLAGDIAVNGDDITSDGNLTINATGYVRVGDTGTPITATDDDDDLYVEGDIEAGGNLYLTGHNIYNVISGTGTGTITLATNPTGPGVAGDYNTLTYGSWLVQNATNNGMAALMVDQTKGGDIFTASASGSPKFTIANSGNVGIGTTSPTTNLFVSDSSGATLGLLRKDDTLTLNEVLGKIDFYGNDTGTGEVVGARILAADDVGAWDTGSQPTRLSFWTTPSGSTTLTEAMTIAGAGGVGIGDTSPTEATLVLGSAGAGDIYLTLATTGTTNNVVCWDNAGATLLYDCDAGPFTDYAEVYPTQPNVDYGDIVTISNQNTTIDRIETDKNGNTLPPVPQTIAVLQKTFAAYDNAIIGIVSQNYSDFASTGHNVTKPEDHPLPIALSGRVPVKISTSSAAIDVGSPITSSADPGRGIKATSAGKIIGTALESWDPANPKDTILVFVNLSWYDPGVYLTDNIRGIIDRIGTFAEIITANIKAGAAEIDKLIAKSVETNLISPIPNEGNIAIRLGKTSTSGEPELTPEEAFGKLSIQNAKSEEVSSLDSEGNATFSGVVTAKEIHSENLEEIEALLAQVQVDQSVLLAATASANMSNNSELITDNLFVTTHAAISSLLVNEDLTVENINSLSEPLRIQSLAAAPIELMAGLIKIDTLGNVQIAGNLEVAGKITAPEADFEKLSVENLIVATSPTSGEPELTPEVLPGDITTNSTVGKGIIPAGADAITITNPKVGNYTLIYVTPTSSTQNKVLFIKAKDAGWFSVGFSEALETDVAFNWWIVETKQ